MSLKVIWHQALLYGLHCGTSNAGHCQSLLLRKTPKKPPRLLPSPTTYTHSYWSYEPCVQPWSTPAFASEESSYNTARSSGVLPCRSSQTITLRPLVHKTATPQLGTTWVPRTQVGKMHHRLCYACKQCAINVPGSGVKHAVCCQIA